MLSKLLVLEKSTQNSEEFLFFASAMQLAISASDGIKVLISTALPQDVKEVWNVTCVKPRSFTKSMNCEKLFASGRVNSDHA